MSLPGARLLFAAAAVLCAAVDNDPCAIAPADEVYPQPILWRGQTVLHMGDSHVSAGLTRGLRRHFDAHGARYVTETWVGSRTKSWVLSGKLDELLGKLRPATVIVTLGTNMMTSPHPERGAQWVEAIVKRIAPRRCYWLGPPPLIEDAFGVNDMLEVASEPCRYFDGRVLTFPVREDGKFHLTVEQGLTWADWVWRWMNGDTHTEILEHGDAV